MTKPATLGLIAALTLAQNLVAAPAAPSPDKDQATSPAEKVRQALNASVTVKVEKQSLTAAIDMLKEKGKVNLVLDAFSIQQVGIFPDQPPTPVDVDLKEVKLISALRIILEPYGLGYAVVGDTVIITTEQMAVTRQMQQRVSLSLDKVELAQALKQLRSQTGVALTLDSRVGKEAKNPVSLELEDVPLETAVRLLAEMAGLKPVRAGNVLLVTKKETAAELRQDPDLAGLNAGPALQDTLENVLQTIGPGGQVVTIRKAQRKLETPAPLPPTTTTAPGDPAAPTVPPAVDDKPPKADSPAPEKKEDK